MGDQRRLDDWAAAAARRPQVLPDGLTPVQTRLVRAVGRGVLPDAGAVFAKLMWFPRGKDRLRYLFRPLPAVHEAAMLEYCRSAGVSVPEVLGVATRRRLGLPALSMLTTRALPAAAGQPAPTAVVAVVQQLLAAGVYHPDLNTGNFVPLADGSVAVLDLQSARRRDPVGSGARAAMLAKLLADLLYHDLDSEPLERAMVAGGLCDEAGLDRARLLAVAFNRGGLVGRIRRCLRESTEFTVTRRPWATEHRRRDLASGGEWVEGGPELVRYWIGDRGLEILQARRPLLGALVRPAAWLPGRPHRVYVAAGGATALGAAAPELLAAHVRYLELDATQRSDPSR